MESISKRFSSFVTGTCFLTKSIFSAKDARRTYQRDDAEEKDFITIDTRSYRHATAPSEADSTATSNKRAAPTATARELVKARSTSRHRTGRDLLPYAGYVVGYVYKSSWFPGVPTTLDGGVRLRPTHAHQWRRCLSVTNIRSERAEPCCFAR